MGKITKFKVTKILSLMLAMMLLVGFKSPQTPLQNELTSIADFNYSSRALRYSRTANTKIEDILEEDNISEDDTTTSYPIPKLIYPEKIPFGKTYAQSGSIFGKSPSISCSKSQTPAELLVLYPDYQKEIYYSAFFSFTKASAETAAKNVKEGDWKNNAVVNKSILPYTKLVAVFQDFEYPEPAKTIITYKKLYDQIVKRYGKPANLTYTDNRNNEAPFSFSSDSQVTTAINNLYSKAFTLSATWKTKNYYFTLDYENLYSKDRSMIEFYVAKS